MTDISKVLSQLKGTLDQAATTIKTIETQYVNDPKNFDSKKAAAQAEQARVQIVSCIDILAEINPEEEGMAEDADFDADTSYFQGDDRPDSAFLLKKYLPRVELLLKETEDLCKPVQQKLQFREYYAITVKLVTLMSMMLDVEYGISLIHNPSAKKPAKPAKKPIPGITDKKAAAKPADSAKKA